MYFHEVGLFNSQQRTQLELPVLRTSSNLENMHSRQATLIRQNVRNSHKATILVVGLAGITPYQRYGLAIK